MARDGYVGAEHAAHEIGAGLILTILAELVAKLDLHSARSGQRRYGLNASVGRARKNTFDRVVGNQLGERCGLRATLFVERPEPIVACPLVALACSRVSDQEHFRRGLPPAAG